MYSSSLLVIHTFLILSTSIPATKCFSPTTYRKTILPTRAMSMENYVTEEQNNFDNEPSITINTYNHKNFKLSYLYKPPSLGYENVPPIVFVHPVGIGLSSWFWSKVMKEFGEENGALYAVDLIGCGLENGADSWDPRKQGLFFPLSWVEGVETFIGTVVLPQYNSNQSIQRKILQNVSKQVNGCTVVVQGGLASVGILLSSRNNSGFISKLILTSPPTWDDMVTPLPENEVEKNYNFLTSSLCLNLGFPILESRAIIRLFSDLFLFEDKCDEAWLDYTMVGASFKEARTPVQVFNAGLLSTRSYQEEMTSLNQQVLIICGNGDKRNKKRIMYTKEMKNCKLSILDGCNVLPWENPTGVIKVISKFIQGMSDVQ